MIVPELRLHISGRIIRVSSVGDLAMISICCRHCSGSVMWKGMKVFVPALQIRISIIPRLSVTCEDRISNTRSMNRLIAYLL
jgi:hypothetical protein